MLQPHMSLSSPPPSYSTHPPGYASTSASVSRKSTNTDNNINNNYNNYNNTVFDPDRDKDKADTKSIASGHSASTTRSQLSSRSDTLRLAIRTDLAAERSDTKLLVRRARCPPELLEEIAKSGVPHDFKTRAESTLRIVSGLEAEALFDRFVGEQECIDQRKSSILDGHFYPLGPVVFAITLLDAGRKVVDYYMTWRGKIPRVRDRRGRRLSFLDSEFRRVARSLDKHYKRIISIVDDASPKSAPARMPDTHRRPMTPPPEPPLQDKPPPSPSPSAGSATASVISLPLLNMIRNVPFGNRQTLRVTNPDTASILSSDANIAEAPSPVSRILDTIAEGVETTVASLTESPTSVHNTSQAAGKRRSKSRSPKHSPTSAPQTPHREKKRSSADDGTSRRGHKHKRDEDRKNRSDDDDSSKRSPKRRHHREHRKHSRDSDTDGDDVSEFTIALLDDNGEKDLLSWHGLNRTDVNNTPRATSTSLDSPWAGPLVSAGRIVFRTPPRQAGEDHSDDESDDDDDRYSYDSRVIPPVTPATHQYPSPLPPVPAALSYAGSASSYGSGTNIIGRPVSSSSCSASYRTAYTYPTHHRASTGSYVPAWINPRHYVTPDTPLTMQTALSYHSGSTY